MGFVLGLLQMLLYGLYRNSKKVIAEQTKLPEHIKSIVILSTLGTAEVYPLDAQPYAADGGDHDVMNKDAKKHEQTDDHVKSMETPVQHELQAIECSV